MRDEHDQIEAEMRAARARLDDARGRVQVAGRRWRDWRTHFQAHPVLTGLAVGAVGFFLVPRRGRTAAATVSSSLRRQSASPVGALLATALTVGLKHGVPLLLGLVAERLQRPKRQGATIFRPDETGELLAPRKPR